MLVFIGLVLYVPGAIFGFRWFSDHKFEYMYGVKPSEQLDKNFWMGIGFMSVGAICMMVGALS